MSALFHAASQALQPPYGGNDAFTKLLVHADSTIVDVSAAGRTLNTYSTTISDAASKFGGRSLARLSGTGPMLSVPDHADFNFGTDDFCIEGFFRREALEAAILFGKRSSSSGVGPFLVGALGGVTRVWLSSNGVTWNIADVVDGPNLPAGVLTHIALYREGTAFSLAVNGVRTPVATSSASLFTNTVTPHFGGDLTGTTLPLLGYMDEIRVSKGVARYPAANFTPPTRPFT